MNAQKPTFTLFALGEVHNATEPCGCTSDPLGDVARVVALLRAAPGPALLLDAGGLRYSSEPLSPDAMRQARLKADFLEHTWAELAAVVAVQPEDLRGGVAELRDTRRIAANLRGLPADVSVKAGELRQVGPVKVGILGIAPPEGGYPWPAGIAATDPLLAAQQEAALLRRQGAELVVALTGLSRQQGRRLLRATSGNAAQAIGSAAPFIDVLVAGGELGDEGIQEAEEVEGGVLVVPAREAQRVVRLDFYGRPGHDQPGQPGPWKLATSPAGQARQVQRLSAERDVMRQQLARLRGDATADPAFVASTGAELARLDQALVGMQQNIPRPKGRYLLMDLLPISRALPRDPAVAAAMSRLDHHIGEENLQAVKGPPPPPLPGQPAYVGNAACAGKCHHHDEALESWRGTLHSHAWQTLVSGDKQLSLDCVGCHATGFGEAGGANLRTLSDSGPWPPLQNVGCEACHGPGSLHIASPAKVPVPVPDPGEVRCQICHTQKHSDTFAFKPYLRDILGTGHGEEKRIEIGDGVTGHQLRQAALKMHRVAP